MTTVCAAISLVPSLRLARSLATRSIAFLSSSLDCSRAHIAKASWKEKALRCGKVAAVAIGIAGLAAASPMLVVASLAADIGLQIIEAGKAIKEKNAPKALLHVAFIAINSLALAAILTASWQLMVAAAAVSAVAMLALSLKAKDVFEFISYMGLFVIGAATAITSAKLTSTSKTDSNFEVRNNSQDRMRIYDKKGNLVAEVPPGEVVTFKVPFADTLQHQSYQAIPGPNGSATIVPTYKGSYVESVSLVDNGLRIDKMKIDALSIDSQTVVTQQPLDAKHFPTLPIGGNVAYISMEKQSSADA